jgi:hypothetical protein
MRFPDGNRHPGARFVAHGRGCPTRSSSAAEGRFVVGYGGAVIDVREGERWPWAAEMPEIGSSRSISGCIAIPAPRPSSRPTVCSKTLMSVFVTRLSSVAAARPANDPPTISTVQRLKSVVITGSSLVPKPAVSVHKLRTAPRCRLPSAPVCVVRYGCFGFSQAAVVGCRCRDVRRW